MRNFCILYNLIPKQKFDSSIWRLLNNRGPSIGRADQFASLSSNAAARKIPTCSTCKDWVISSGQGLFGFYFGRNIEFGRNFSTSVSVRSFKQMSEQDKEKFKNYVFFGAVFVLVLSVIITVQNLEYHQDYVYIEPSDEKK